MKSNILCVSATLLALSLAACSSEPKYENTKVPEMSTTMPPEISTVDQPSAEPDAVTTKKVTKKKKKVTPSASPTPTPAQ